MGQVIASPLLSQSVLNQLISYGESFQFLPRLPQPTFSRIFYSQEMLRTFLFSADSSCFKSYAFGWNV